MHENLASHRQYVEVEVEKGSGIGTAPVGIPLLFVLFAHV